MQPILKRRIALLKSMGRIPDAIKALTSFLDASPTDAEAWAEISDLYAGEGLYQQAIFALEEVMLITPNAWNVGHTVRPVLFERSLTWYLDASKTWRGAVHYGHCGAIRCGQIPSRVHPPFLKEHRAV